MGHVPHKVSVGHQPPFDANTISLVSISIRQPRMIAQVIFAVYLINLAQFEN